MAPTGIIYGKDTRGNFKVSCPGLRRDVILSYSNNDPDLRMGVEVSCVISSSGDYVFFAKDYETTGRVVTECCNTRGKNENKAFPPAPARPKRIPKEVPTVVELVLRDEYTRDVLVIGSWAKPPISFYDDKGDICGRQYVLGGRVIRLQTEEALLALLGIGEERMVGGVYPGENCTSILQLALADSSNPDKTQLEKLINRHLPKPAASESAESHD
ncbi:MAG: hypothetical protein V1659_01765 [Candidatus Woesearchaeota archaeon]